MEEDLDKIKKEQQSNVLNLLLAVQHLQHDMNINIDKVLINKDRTSNGKRLH